MPLAISSSGHSLLSGNHWSVCYRYRLVCIYRALYKRNQNLQSFVSGLNHSQHIMLLRSNHATVCNCNSSFWPLSSDPVDGWISVYSPADRHWVVSSLGLSWTKLLETAEYKSLCEYVLFSFLLGKYLGVGWLSIHLASNKLPKFSKGSLPFIFLSAAYDGSNCSISSLGPVTH